MGIQKDQYKNTYLNVLLLGIIISESLEEIRAIKTIFESP
jgi:hypothetical protein